ncbi:TonB-dependent siderophore receptor [Synechococcales cyanobacterium C]|uniref:TonB-dependent siderophore receptor n=1 Tax=Petrachloros mirabilis ULC683 TaxID=2781853 RepID=A0A8K2A9U2_9CYAN|nr:TonB-dependent siderophore receptor [Petrachloros mirabilis]NCJ08619.1 TonB-dependent siderophore receptor [Petrachloros mirabilis ULC683]
MKAQLLIQYLCVIGTILGGFVPAAWAGGESVGDGGGEPTLSADSSTDLPAHPPTHLPTHLPAYSTAATTVDEWMAQIAQSLTQITNVQVNPTEAGLELILQTAEGELPVPTPSVVGNALIAEIPNAVLALPEGNSFEQFNPAEGIALVSVTGLPGDRVRVSITGTDAPPEAQVSTEAGNLVLSVVPGMGQVGDADDAIQIVVTGEQDEGYNPSTATTATRTDTPLRDIPQSIQVIPRQVIEDQGTTNISDALRNVSGVNIRAGYGGRNDNYVIRGFNTFERLRNGFLAREIDVNPNNIERIEVLKGPASILYGAIEPGGVINFVTKQPLERPYYEAEFTAGSYSFYQPSIDLSGPLTTDRSLLYRLNAAYENSGSFVDFVDREVIQVSPTLSYRLGEDTDLSLSYEYLRSDGDWYDGLPRNPIFSDLRRSLFVGEPDVNSRTEESHFGNLTLDHRFNENWQIRSGFALKFSQIQGARFRSTFLIEPDGTMERIYQFDPFANNDTYSIQTDLSGRFNTGSIAHQLLFGIEFSRTTSDQASSVASADSINVFNPVYGAPIPTVFDRVSERFGDRTQTIGLYLQDQVTLLPNLNLLIGGRYDFVNQTSRFQLFDTDAETPLDEASEDDFYNGAFSPRVGIVYQPIEPISLYASYSRSFVPNNAFTRTGELIEPTRGTQYEVGIKTDWLDGRLSATLAAYQITRTNELRVDPEDDSFSIAAGEARSRGIELDLAGEPLPGWNIIASAFLNDAVVTVGDEFTPEGARLVNAPRVGASLWTTYEIQRGDLQGLGFGGGIFYSGEREVLIPNTFELPANVRIDAAIFYRRDNWRVGLNFKNILDRTNYNFQGRGILVDNPFTVLGTVSVQF